MLQFFPNGLFFLVQNLTSKNCWKHRDCDWNVNEIGCRTPMFHSWCLVFQVVIFVRNLSHDLQGIICEHRDSSARFWATIIQPGLICIFKRTAWRFGVLCWSCSHRFLPHFPPQMSLTWRKWTGAVVKTESEHPHSQHIAEKAVDLDAVHLTDGL